MADMIYVQGLEVEATLGIYAWERAIKQRITVDFEIRLPESQAANDNIESTINYEAVATTLRAAITDSRFNLLESLAAHCAQIILEKFAVPALRLRLNKSGVIPRTKNSGIVIERGDWT